MAKPCTTTTIGIERRAVQGQLHSAAPNHPSCQQAYRIDTTCRLNGRGVTLLRHMLWINSQAQVTPCKQCCADSGSPASSCNTRPAHNSSLSATNPTRCCYIAVEPQRRLKRAHYKEPELCFGLFLSPFACSACCSNDPNHWHAKGSHTVISCSKLGPAGCKKKTCSLTCVCRAHKGSLPWRMLPLRDGPCQTEVERRLHQK